VKRASGDGYESLHAMMFHVLPILDPLAASKLTEYPTQEKHESMSEFYRRYMDFLRNRALIMDIPADLTLVKEMDIFISKTYHCKWLLSVTRNERADPTQSHKYTGEQIANTLSTFLAQLDSPALSEKLTLREKPTSTAGIHHTNTGKTWTYNRNRDNDQTRNSRQQRVNNIQFGHNYNRFSPLQDDEESEDDTESEEALASLQAEFFQMYQRGINVIKADTKAMDRRPCVVCKGHHTFADCGVLNDHEFLKTHYINFCQQVRREAKLRADAFKGVAGQLPVDNSTGNGQDFHTGQT
jgi:hypothetical protein